MANILYENPTSVEEFYSPEDSNFEYLC